MKPTLWKTKNRGKLNAKVCRVANTMRLYLERLG
jgi:hypothetical protein